MSNGTWFNHILSVFPTCFYAFFVRFSNAKIDTFVRFSNMFFSKFVRFSNFFDKIQSYLPKGDS